jgi:hypothetical protein
MLGKNSSNFEYHGIEKTKAPVWGPNSTTNFTKGYTGRVSPKVVGVHLIRD